MEIYFNELSLVESTLSIELLEEIARIAGLFRKYGINTCRISDSNYTIIISYLLKKEQVDHRARQLKNLLFSFLRCPYENDGLSAKFYDEYLNYNWLYEDKECYGMALAYIMGSFSVSFNYEPWQVTPIVITKDGSALEVDNVANELLFTAHEEKLDNLGNLELQETALLPEKKVIKLRDDHGKDVLMAFSKKLVRSPFVVGVMNSLEFHSFDKKFIREVRADGIVHIVLINTDCGFGVAVKTTGRNKRETETIAKILEKEYCGA